ncbi:MAG TPA: ATP-grasp domain-containing protein, partial [Chthoniobacteraceae bacterium]
GSPPYFIKDHAKSAKELWPKGCLVKAEEGIAGMRRGIEALREWRGDRFEGGIVVRPFTPLRYLEEHPVGGPIYEEYRLFFFRSRLILRAWYGRAGGDLAALPDYSFLGERLLSPFFTADIVRTDAGDLRILEIGDGGYSALPPMASAREFYRAMLTDRDGPTSWQ